MTTDDKLEALLAEPEVYLDDDGFSARVVARLPTKRPRWRQTAFLVLFGCVGAALGPLLPSPGWSQGLHMIFAPGLILVTVGVLVVLALGSVLEPEG
jgi:hypothetical protein